MRISFGYFKKLNLLSIIFCVGFGLVLNAQTQNTFSIKRSIIKSTDQSVENNIIEYSVYQNKNKIYTINIELHYDVPIPGIRIFESGGSVIINSFDASLHFYSNAGADIAKVKIQKDIDVAYERSVYSCVSGDRLAIALIQPEHSYSLIQIYNQDGSLIDQWKMKEKYINGLCYSHLGGVTAVSVFKRQQNKLIKDTYFVEQSGKLLTNIPHNFTSGRFIDNGNLFVGNTNQECFAYDLKNIQIVFEQQSIDDKMILTTKITDDRIIIVQSDKPYLEKSKWMYQNVIFLIYNYKGEIQSTEKISSSPFSEYEFVKDENEIFFKTENENIFIE